MLLSTGRFFNGAGGGGGGGDPHFANVVLLCGFEGADASTTFDDESASNHALTAVGNAQLDTAQFKFGTSSLLLDGTGDVVTAPNSSDFLFGAGQFTIEFHIRIASAGLSDQWVVCLYDTSSQRSWGVRIQDSINQINFTKSTDGASGSTALNTGWAPSTNTWYHVAFDRDGSGVMRFYVDGSFLAKITDAANLFASTAKLSIGGFLAAGAASGGYVNGWLDELRITKGVARYASDGGFTAPTAAYPRS